MTTLKDKFAAVIYGTAIGDAIGYQVEFQRVLPSHPVVSGMRKTPCLYSDDTQMMRAVLEGLMEARTWKDVAKAGREVAKEFVMWSHSPENNRAPGNTCMRACANLVRGVSWTESGVPDSKGCGSVMRSMAYGLWFHNNHKKAGSWAATHSSITHGHPAAIASSGALAAAIVSLLNDENPKKALDLAKDTARIQCKNTAAMLDSIEHRLDDSPDDVLGQWEGWTGDEALCAAFWVFLRHHTDFRSAILTAANTPGDSDSIACIVGALMGAYHGMKVIPLEWVNGVEKSEELKELGHRVWKVVKEGVNGKIQS